MSDRENEKVCCNFKCEEFDERCVFNCQIKDYFKYCEIKISVKRSQLKSNQQ